MTARLFFSYALAVVGGLIALTAGLCSLAVFGSFSSRDQSDPQMWMLVLTVGGIPFAVGIALLITGLYFVRRIRARSE
jgi:hypothetical protein